MIDEENFFRENQVKIENGTATQVDYSNQIKLLYKSKNYIGVVRFVETYGISLDDPLDEIFGLSLFQSGNLDKSVSFLRDVHVRRPTLQTLGNYCVSLKKVGRYQDAVDLILTGKWDELSEDFGIELGVLYYALRQPDKAIAAYRRQKDRNPRSSRPYLGIANVALSERNNDLAIELFEKICDNFPNEVLAHNNLATMYKQIGKLDEAMELFKRSFQIKPSPLNASNLAFCSNYFGDETIVSEAHVLAAKTINKISQTEHPDARQKSFGGKGKVKVAFVSGDLRWHSVSYFLLPLLKSLKENFEIHLVSTAAASDDMTQKLAANCSNFHACGNYSDYALTGLIRSLNVDVAFDLSGHSKGNGLSAFSARVAPKQVAYLGYPNTTGLETMDYRVTDYICDPVGEEEYYYTENLLRLPRCFLTYERQRAPAIMRLDVPQSNLVYGSFNNSSKINGKVLEAWCEILKRRKNARLLIKNGYSNSLNFQNYVKHHASKHDVVGQITFLPYAESSDEALQFYNACDLHLDTFPFSGATTTCEALMMGVPTLTIDEGPHRARVSSSIMQNSGLNSFCVKSIEEYIEFASNFHGDMTLERKQAIKHAFVSGSVCSSSSFAADFTSMIKQIVDSKQ